MSTGYWSTVPKGTWSITDPTDVLDALGDQESCWEFDKRKGRINIFGPAKKALIVDLNVLKDEMDTEQEFLDFMKEVEIKISSPSSLGGSGDE